MITVAITANTTAVTMTATRAITDASKIVFEFLGATSSMGRGGVAI